MPCAIQVTATLSLAAACSSAGVTILFARDQPFCGEVSQLSCGKYEISIVLAFITWLLVALSSLITFWLLASAWLLLCMLLSVRRIIFMWKILYIKYSSNCCSSCSWSNAYLKWLNHWTYFGRFHLFLLTHEALDQS